MKKEIFPADAYIVLLTVGNGDGKIHPSGNSIPTDYVYQLRQPFREDGVYIKLDTRGSKANGYSTSNLTLRAATEAEIAEYMKANGPCPALPTPKIIDNYQIY